MFVDILSHHVDALEDFLAFGGVGQLNAVSLFEQHNELQSVDGVESKSTAEQGGVLGLLVPVGGDVSSGCPSAPSPYRSADP